MERAAPVLNLLLRVCGGAALALGLALWLGYARSLTRLHIVLGIGVVLSLWALAGITWKKTSRRGFASFAAVWGLVSWAVGMTQSQMLPGSLHWIVEVAHTAIGVVAIAVGSRLAIGVAARHIAPHSPM